MGAITNLDTPWFQFATLNPAGNRLYHLDWDATPVEIDVHTVPLLGYDSTIAAPALASGRYGSTAGICTDAAGTLYYAAYEKSASSSQTPRYQYNSEVWSWNGSSWTSLWSDQYYAASAPAAGAFEELIPNGITYDSFLDDVYFVTTDQTTGRVRQTSDSSVVTSVAHGSISATWGLSHFVIHPDDGSIWVTYLTGGAYRFRRFASGFGSSITINYQPIGASGSGTPSRAVPSPDHSSQMLIVARAGGVGTYEVHRVNSSGTVLETVSTCTNGSPFGVSFTPSLSRIISLQFLVGTNSQIVDWTQRCDPDPTALPSVGFLAG